MSSSELEAAAVAVEQALRRFIDSTRPDLSDDRSPADPVGDAFADIRDALKHMRFETPYVPDSVFKHVSFGTTPTMPTGSMWPEHALPFAWLRTERTTCIEYSYERFSELIDALEALQRRLVFEADCQESIDAHNTSRQYLQSAGYLDRAVAALVTSWARRGAAWI